MMHRLKVEIALDGIELGAVFGLTFFFASSEAQTSPRLERQKQLDYRAGGLPNAKLKTHTLYDACMLYRRTVQPASHPAFALVLACPRHF